MPRPSLLRLALLPAPRAPPSLPPSPGARSLVRNPHVPPDHDAFICGALHPPPPRARLSLSPLPQSENDPAGPDRHAVPTGVCFSPHDHHDVRPAAHPTLMEMVGEHLLASSCFVLDELHVRMSEPAYNLVASLRAPCARPAIHRAGSASDIQWLTTRLSWSQR